MNRFLFPDARLFGLPIWPRRLTDAEYIERVRKQQRMHRWVRVFYGVFGVGTAFLCVWMVQKCLDAVLQGGFAPAQQGMLQLALFIALFAGFSVGWMIYGILHAAINLMVESRRDRMLVECWDLLHKLIAERDAVAIETTAPAAARCG